MKTIDDLYKKLDNIEKKIPSMKSDIASEQIEYNKQLDLYLEELVQYELYVKKIMDNKINDIISNSDNDLDKLGEDLEDIKKILQYNYSEDDFLKSSGLDKIIYKISYSKDVDIINKNINKYIECLESYNVKLEVSDYNYSYYTLKYMSMFYDNDKDSNFYINMKKYFEEIYWVCPNIIKQLVLNFIEIASKNKKNIYNNIVNKRNELIKKLDLANKDINEIFMVKLNEYEKIANKNTFYIYELLSNNTELLKNFSNFKYNDLIKKYSNKEFVNVNDEELFIDNIDSFRSNLIEYVDLKKYNYIFDYENDVLKNKASKVKDNIKELAKLNKKKDSYNKKLIKLNNKKDSFRLFGSSNATLDKKIRVNNAYLINCCNEIYKLTFKNYIERFNQDIINNIDGNSNIYEALLIANKHYLALSNIIYEKELDVDICDEINMIENILYTRNSLISRNTTLDFYDNISSLINKKYLLCNINMDIDYEDYSAIKTMIDEEYFMVLSYNLKKKDLSIKDIEICVSRTQE